GPLYIGQNPTKWRNQHLVLKFDLSSISVGDSNENLENSFNQNINRTLTKFIIKYTEELGTPRQDDVIDTSDGSRSLANVLVSNSLSYYMLLVYFISNLRFYFIARIWLAIIIIPFLSA